MTVQAINTLVIGAGQAGIAASEHLGMLGISHLVLERHRVAERWRTDRWDSLVANGPAWHDRFPNAVFPGISQDAFASKTQVVDYFDAYAKAINAPIRTGVEVTMVVRNLGRPGQVRPGEGRPGQGRPGFKVDTTAGVFEAQNLIVATGPFQSPVIPAIASDDSRYTQMHSVQYKNPGQLPEGGVLVVGAGSSGVQIAEELMRAGRDVYLSVGPHDRPPRRYRNRDFCWWLGVLGLWDAEIATPGKEHVTIAVSGAYGGHTIDFRELAQRGMTLLGRTRHIQDGKAVFEADLADNIRAGDASLMALLDAADAYAARHGLDLPQDPEARRLLADPLCMLKPALELDLLKAGVRTIIWATGFGVDYGWLQVDAFDANGKPKHQRGVSTEPGVYFLGLPWLSRRGSAFIWGVWHDAKHVAGHIAIRQAYEAYRVETPQPACASAASAVSD